MSGYGPDINQNWSGSSFVPGDGCNRSGDQQEARKTCIPGRLIIKLATAGLAGSVEREQREAACGRPCQLILFFFFFFFLGGPAHKQAPPV